MSMFPMLTKNEEKKKKDVTKTPKGHKKVKGQVCNVMSLCLITITIYLLIH